MKKHTGILLFFILIVSTYGFCQSEQTIKLRVACVGNSITEGFGLDNPATEAYPAILGNLLGDQFEVKNFGLSCRTVLSKGDYPWMQEPQFSELKAFAPEYIVIKLGTNDSKDYNWKYKNEFQKDLETMIDTFMGFYPLSPCIIICTPVPVLSDNNKWGLRDKIIKKEIIPIIKQVAIEKNLVVIDLHTKINKSLYLPDNVHLNTEGSKYLAKKIYDEFFSLIPH